jgi:hypothetical protein
MSNGTPRATIMELFPADAQPVSTRGEVPATSVDCRGLQAGAGEHEPEGRR